MKHLHILLAFSFVLLCDLGHAAFCSDDEEAGECFDDKIKPLAIGATVVAFLLGISIVLLAVALLCKAKRRQRAKVLVYRKANGTRENSGFESASQYHVKRPTSYEPEEPTFYMSRNAARPARGYDADIPVAALAEDEKSDSPVSSRMMWVPTSDKNNDDKKFRANPLAGRSGIYQ